MEEENCTGCGHLLRRHFMSVDGKVYCLHISSGTTTRGVIGMPWTDECDCADYVSERRIVKEEADKKEREEWEAELQPLVDNILQRLGKNKS